MELPRNKNPWHDRFARPDDTDFEHLYEPDRLDVLGQLRDMVGTRTGAKPTPEWRGIAWRWTLVFTRPDEQEPWAYIIPADERPIVALPVPANPLSPAELKKTPGFIRDRVLHAPRVGQICWVELPIDSQTQAAELERFIDRVTEPQPA